MFCYFLFFFVDFVFCFGLYIILARCIGRLPPTFDMLMNEHTHAFYGKFATVKSNNPPLNQRGGGQQRAGRSGAGRDPRASRQQGQHRSARADGRKTRTSSGASQTTSPPGPK